MKNECEGLFIELISPYLTALEAAKSARSEDWHAVFAFAEALINLPPFLVAGFDIESYTDFATLDFMKVREMTKELSDYAVNQSSRQMHGEKTSQKIDSDAMFLIAEIQSEIRKIVLDNVCACELGPKVGRHEVGKFPKQDRALDTLKALSGTYQIIQVHDDGDLTVESGGQKRVVTTDGGIYRQET